MPSINMIAARRAEKVRLEKMMRIAFLVIVGEAVLMLFLLGFMTTRIFSANREITRLDNELARIQPTVEKIKAYEAEIKKLEPRLNLLADSREQTMLWFNILQNLSRSMPEKTWVSNVTTSRAAPTGPAGREKQSATTLTVRGMSVSQGLVGETMLRLGQYPEFKKVNLDYTQEASSRDFEAVEFQLGALLNEPKPQKGGTSGDAIR